MKINLKEILYIMLFIPFINITIFSQYANIRDVLQCISLLIMTCILIKKNIKIDKFDIFVIIFVTYILVISLIRRTISFGIIVSTVELFIITKFVKESLKKSNIIISAFYVLYATLAVLNFILIIGRNITEDFTYLLGGKNALAIILIPTLYFISINSIIKYNKITFKNLILEIIIITTMIISRSGTGIVLSIMALISILFIDKININKKVFAITYVVIFVIVLNIQLLSNIGIIKTIVIDYLQKDLTLTGRTEIWSGVIEFIKDNFLFGYGRGNSVVSSFSKLFECHNMLLEILLCGGLCFLASYILILKETFIKVNKSEDKINKRLDILSLIFVFLFFIIGLTESVPFKIEIWIMFAIIYSIDNIIKNRERLKENEEYNSIYTNLQ